MKYQKRSDNIYGDYEYYTGKVGLFGKAFFGWKKTKTEQAKLNYIWKQLLKQHKRS